MRRSKSCCTRNARTFLQCWVFIFSSTASVSSSVESLQMFSTTLGSQRETSQSEPVTFAQTRSPRFMEENYIGSSESITEDTPISQVFESHSAITTQIWGETSQKSSSVGYTLADVTTQSSLNIGNNELTKTKDAYDRNSPLPKETSQIPGLTTSITDTETSVGSSTVLYSWGDGKTTRVSNDRKDFNEIFHYTVQVPEVETSPVRTRIAPRVVAVTLLASALVLASIIGLLQCSATKPPKRRRRRESIQMHLI